MCSTTSQTPLNMTPIRRFIARRAHQLARRNGETTMELPIAAGLALMIPLGAGTAAIMTAFACEIRKQRRLSGEPNQGLLTTTFARFAGHNGAFTD